MLKEKELSAEIASNETNPAIMIDMTKTSIKECHTKPVQPGLHTILIYGIYLPNLLSAIYTILIGINRCQ